MIAVVEKHNGVKASSSKKASYDRKETKAVPVLPPFPCRAKKAVTLLEEWVKDRIIRLLDVEFLSSFSNQKDVKFCLYYRRKGHTLEQCVSFRRISTRNTKSVRFCSRRDSLNDLPFSKHNNR